MSSDDKSERPVHVWATDLTEKWFHADTDRDPGDDNMQIAGFDIQPQVFFISAGLILLFIAFTILFTDTAGDLYGDAFDFTTENFGWFYIIAANIFIIVVLYFALGKYGNIRLGGVDADKEFSDTSWIAMLFSAGMGIGLMFWSVGEPLFHMADPLFGTAGLDHTLAGGEILDADGNALLEWEPVYIVAEQVPAAEIGVLITYFHWAFHPWAIYGVVGLALAFFAFNRGLPLTFRSVFWPVLGNKIYGWIGHLVDILAIFATLFGLGTSLGLGAMQINAGLDVVGDAVLGMDIPAEDVGVQIGIIAVITAIAVVSVALGIHRGIRVLSNVNVGLMFLLMFSVLILGPTLFVLEFTGQSIGYYLQNLPEMSFMGEATGFEGSLGVWEGFTGAWTVFYWGWWIAWSPFVGMFIARISRGRTVREFVLGVLILPVLFSFLFIGIMGGAAMEHEIGAQDDIDAALADMEVTVADLEAEAPDIYAQYEAGEITADQALAIYATEEGQISADDSLIAPVFEAGEEVAMFEMFDTVAMTALLSILAVVLVTTFFVTSSDSGSLVLGHLSSGGKHAAPRNQRISWAIIEGATAAVLLLAGTQAAGLDDALSALQTASIVAGLPFAVVLLFMCYSTWRGFKNEYATLRSEEFEEAVAELLEDEEGLSATKAGRGVYTRIEEDDDGGG